MNKALARTFWLPLANLEATVKLFSESLNSSRALVSSRLSLRAETVVAVITMMMIAMRPIATSTKVTPSTRRRREEGRGLIATRGYQAISTSKGSSLTLDTDSQSTSTTTWAGDAGTSASSSTPGTLSSRQASRASRPTAMASSSRSSESWVSLYPLRTRSSTDRACSRRSRRRSATSHSESAAWFSGNHLTSSVTTAESEFKQFQRMSYCKVRMVGGIIELN